jgi:hypothetical protein
MIMLDIISLVFDLLQFACLLAIGIYIYKPKPQHTEPKKDKYEDYRDPGTGRLRAKKVNSL